MVCHHLFVTTMKANLPKEQMCTGQLLPGTGITVSIVRSISKTTSVGSWNHRWQNVQDRRDMSDNPGGVYTVHQSGNFDLKVMR